MLYYDRPRVIAPGESITFGFDCTADLPDGETLTTDTALASVPVSADVTIGAATVNTETFENDDGETVAVGKGVQVQITIAADAEDANYELAGIAQTSSGDKITYRGGLHVRRAEG